MRLGCGHHRNNHWPALRGGQEEIMNEVSGSVNRYMLGKNCKNAYNLTTPGSYLYYTWSRLGKGGFLLNMTAKHNNKCKSISPHTLYCGHRRDSGVMVFSGYHSRQESISFRVRLLSPQMPARWIRMFQPTRFPQPNTKVFAIVFPPIRNPTPHFLTVQPHERPQALQEEDVI